MKKNDRTDMDECLEHAVSANECTGALQHIAIDPQEVAKFHSEFIGDWKR